MSTWWHTSHWTCPRPQLHSGEKLHFTLAMWLVLSAKSAKFGLKVPAHTNWNTCSHKHSLILMCWCGVFQGFPAGQFRIWRICGLGPAGWVWLDHTTAGLCYGQSVLVAVVSLCWGFGCYGQFVLESWCYDQFNNNNDSNNVFFYVPFLLLSTRPITWNKIIKKFVLKTHTLCDRLLVLSLFLFLSVSLSLPPSFSLPSLSLPLPFPHTQSVGLLKKIWF